MIQIIITDECVPSSSPCCHKCPIVTVTVRPEIQDSTPAPPATLPSAASRDSDELDSLFASAASRTVNTPEAKADSDVVDLNLDDLLGPPPQRFQGGGRPAGGAGDEWNEPSGSSYGGGGGGSSYGEEFGAARGKFGADPEAAHQKAVRGDRLISQVEVSDDGACPVAEKDVDAQTVASLAKRGIETFTPVQVCVLCYMCVLFILHISFGGVLIGVSGLSERLLFC